MASDPGQHDRASKYWGLLTLRAGFALLLFGLHGWSRLVHASSYLIYGQPWAFVTVVDQLGFPAPVVFALLSTFAESIATILVGLGVLTRAAAFVIAINMTVALASEAAKGDPFELPGLYLLIALTLVVTGGGRLTVARLVGRV